MNIDIIIYCSFLFFLSELILAITKRSKKKQTSVKKDKWSLTLLWIAIPVSITTGFFMANDNEWNLLNDAVAFFGLFVFLAGLTIRWVSIIQLNREFTVDVVITKDHRLKTDGIYKRIRHPSYSGLFLICAGLSIAMNSPISFLIVSIPVFLAIVYRIEVEEAILIKEFGEAYEEYMGKTHKIIPKLF